MKRDKENERTEKGTRKGSQMYTIIEKEETES